MHTNRSTIVIVSIITSLTACGWFQGAPESRAKNFIETIVVDPHADDRLRAIANAPDVQPSTELVQGMAAEVALDYLRAKHNQGIAMDFTLGKIQKTEKDHRRIPVIVTLSEIKPVQHYRVQFMVEFKKETETGWRILRVWAGG